jgi:hypothetical protein
MFIVATVLKGLVEVLLVVMLGQGLLYLFAGSRRQENLIYRAFAVVTAPILKATRVITPRFIVDAHIGYVAFFLLVVLWILALALKVQAVLQAAKPPA